MKVKIEGYLTEKKLGAVLKQVFDDVQEQVMVPNSRFRWDFLVDKNIVVEFDGYRHYCQTQVMFNDIKKDEIAKKLGYKIIRIPYWVQLTSETFKDYFGFDLDIDQNYPHGFIDKKAVLPADFCELGIQRFHIDMGKCCVFESVLASLNNQSKAKDNPYLVMPVSLASYPLT